VNKLTFDEEFLSKRPNSSFSFDFYQQPRGLKPARNTGKLLKEARGPIFRWALFFDELIGKSRVRKNGNFGKNWPFWDF
jgi:hypothetical protein